jgi:hypothetical protein
MDFECYKLLARTAGKLWSYNICLNDDGKLIETPKHFKQVNPYAIEYKKNKIIQPLPEFPGSLLFVFDKVENVDFSCFLGTKLVVYRCTTSKLIKPITNNIYLNEKHWNSYWESFTNNIPEPFSKFKTFVLPPGSMFCPDLKLIEEVKNWRRRS